MTFLKRVSIGCAALMLFFSPIYAQQEMPNIELDFSERCNNFLRHYCMSGTHEEQVNQMLLSMKQKGTNITVKLIKQIARSTPSKPTTQRRR